MYRAKEVAIDIAKDLYMYIHVDIEAFYYMADFGLKDHIYCVLGCPKFSAGHPEEGVE